jgi:hypothetical protein
MDATLGKAIDFDVAIDQTMGDAKVKLVLLDASRNNPFPPAAKTARQIGTPAAADF